MISEFSCTYYHAHNRIIISPLKTSLKQVRWFFQIWKHIYVRHICCAEPRSAFCRTCSALMYPVLASPIGSTQVLGNIIIINSDLPNCFRPPMYEYIFIQKYICFNTLDKCIAPNHVRHFAEHVRRSCTPCWSPQLVQPKYWEISSRSITIFPTVSNLQYTNLYVYRGIFALIH
jgi:hypothetical protein